jgi:hypothetical protein
MIHAALASRQFAFETARGAVGFIRKRQRKSA